MSVNVFLFLDDRQLSYQHLACFCSFYTAGFYLSISETTNKSLLMTQHLVRTQDKLGCDILVL